MAQTKLNTYWRECQICGASFGFDKTCSGAYIASILKLHHQNRHNKIHRFWKKLRRER